MTMDTTAAILVGMMISLIIGMIAGMNIGVMLSLNGTAEAACDALKIKLFDCP